MNTSKQASSVYNGIAEQYAKKEFSKPSEHIEEFFSSASKNAKILDVGCGVGVDAGFMVAEGFEIIGIDLSKEMLNIARQNFLKSILDNKI